MPLDDRPAAQSFDVARRALENSTHPFGAILVGPDGEVLLEQGNAYMPDHDMTGHAERVLMTRASTRYTPEFLSRCTMYTSAEPCAMCAVPPMGRSWARGLRPFERSLKDLTGNHPENPTLDLPCRIVFDAGQRKVEVLGPLLEDEAAALHEGIW